MTNKKIGEVILGQLREMLESGNAENSVKEVVSIDKKNQTITIKFTYHEVPEDKYIGLGSY